MTEINTFGNSSFALGGLTFKRESSCRLSRPSAKLWNDWCNMQDKLLSYEPSYIKERNAIARLLKDCADASNTNYPKMSIRDIHHIDIGYDHKVFVSNSVDSWLKPC